MKTNKRKGITNAQAKYLAALQREAGVSYSGRGMSFEDAKLAISRLVGEGVNGRKPINGNRLSASSKSKGLIELWVDGACAKNPGPGGWAFVLVFPSGRRIEGSGPSPVTTNNRMELSAVIEGLSTLPAGVSVRVVSDSAYVVDPFVKDWISRWERENWEDRKNVDLLVRLLAEVRLRDVTWRRVKGHSGLELNERCDELAVAATLLAGGNPASMVEFNGKSKHRRVNAK